MGNYQTPPLQIELEGVNIHCHLAVEFSADPIVIDPYLPPISALRTCTVTLEMFVPLDDIRSRNIPGLITLDDVDRGDTAKRIMDRLLLEVGKRYGKWTLTDRYFEYSFGNALEVKFTFMAPINDFIGDNEALPSPKPQLNSPQVIYLGPGEVK